MDDTNLELNYASEIFKHTEAGTAKTTFLKYLAATTTKFDLINVFTTHKQLVSPNIMTLKFKSSISSNLDSSFSSLQAISENMPDGINTCH